MSVFPRFAGVLGLACFLANAAFAAPDVIPAVGTVPPDPPSATAIGLLDDRVSPVSNEQPVACAACGDCCNNGDTCAMGPMDCGCDPTWDVTAGAIFLNRSRPNQSSILTPIGAPGIISNGGDFGFGWNAGPDVTVSKQMANGLTWEVRYFNDDEAAASADYPGVTGARVFGTNILGITSLTASDFTRLDSGELNVRAPLNDFCTFLIGFRTLDVHDRLTYTYNQGVLTTTFDDGNRLYGGQIGMDLGLLNYGGPLRLDAALKAGVYSNGAEDRFTANAIFASSGASGTSAAFVGDIDITASYKLTKHCSIRGGYQLLWIEDLALATDNAAVAAASGLGTGINTRSALFYQGATAAVEYAW